LKGCAGRDPADGGVVPAVRHDQAALGPDQAHAGQVGGGFQFRPRPSALERGPEAFPDLPQKGRPGHVELAAG